MSWIHWSRLSAFFAGVTGFNSNFAMAILTEVILVFAWAIVFIFAKPAEIVNFSSRTWCFLTLSGVATGLSWLCYFHALQLGGAL